LAQLNEICCDLTRHLVFWETSHVEVGYKSAVAYNLQKPYFFAINGDEHSKESQLSGV